MFNIYKNSNINPNLKVTEENIPIASQEFLESEKSISPYSFSLANKLFKKAMTEIKQQNLLTFSHKKKF